MPAPTPKVSFKTKKLINKICLVLYYVIRYAFCIVLEFED